MRLYPGRRTLKYIGFPAIVAAGLVWKGSSHYKSSVSWPTDDVLLNVQVFHRHGDRVPISLLRDKNKENELWARKISKQYSTLRYEPVDADDDAANFNTTNATKLSEIYQWKNIAKRLNGTYIVHKTDNYDMHCAYLVSSKDTDKQTQDILSNMQCWDSSYAKQRHHAFWSGQLTEKGVDGMISLGSWLRERYVKKLAFLSPTYNNDTKTSNPSMVIAATNSKQQLNGEQPCLYYISTNLCRCIQSADAVLQGLYPLQNRANESSIPIHCDHAKTWLYPNPKCKRARKRQQENEATLSQNEDAEMCAVKKKLLDFYGCEERPWLYVCEAIGCRLHHEIDLPPHDVVSDKELRDFINYTSFRICKYHGMDRDCLKLTAGVLLRKMVDNMNKLENKFVIYSCHDGTLQRLLIALANVKEFRFPWPAYSASLIFELWEKNIIRDEDKKSFMMGVGDWFNGIDNTRSKYVRILYEGKVLQLDGEEFVPVAVLGEMWKDIMIDEETYWDRECVC